MSGVVSSCRPARVLIVALEDLLLEVTSFGGF